MVQDDQHAKRRLSSANIKVPSLLDCYVWESRAGGLVLLLSTIFCQQGDRGVQLKQHLQIVMIRWQTHQRFQILPVLLCRSSPPSMKMQHYLGNVAPSKPRRKVVSIMVMTRRLTWLLLPLRVCTQWRRFTGNNQANSWLFQLGNRSSLVVDYLSSLCVSFRVVTVSWS